MPRINLIRKQNLQSNTQDQETQLRDYYFSPKPQLTKRQMIREGSLKYQLKIIKARKEKLAQGQ